MSERELRELGKRIVDEAVYETIMGRACTYCGEGTERRTDELVHGFDCLTGKMNKALAAPPDVVVVMRKIVDEVCKCTLSPEQAWSVGLIKWWIEEEFHVRLTEDGGWEWTE